MGTKFDAQKNLNHGDERGQINGRRIGGKDAENSGAHHAGIKEPNSTIDEVEAVV